MAAAGGLHAAAPGARLRVVTYNVHMEGADTIAGAIQSNRNLRELDILLLQELEAHDAEGTTRAEQIAERLGMSFAYAPGYGLRGGGSHGVAIISRYALRDVEIIELPYFHVVVNSARRVALAATILMGERAVRIFSVHLDNRLNPAQRRKQLAPVFQAAEHHIGPAIIAGDLNTSPFCWAFSLLPLPCGLQDNVMESEARARGFQTPVVESGPTSMWLAMRLDAIYVRGLRTIRFGVEGAVQVSDHLPLWVDLMV